VIDRAERERRIAERDQLAQDAMPMLDHRSESTAIESTKSPTLIRRLGRIGVIAFVLYICLVAVLPWQQFVPGKGRVIAFDPLDRPQLLEAPLPGRIVESRVVEGQRVSQGEVLFVMADNDPELAANLEEQQVAARESLDQAATRLREIRNQLAAAQEALPEVVAAAELQLDAAQIAAETAEAQYVRIKELFESDIAGLVSRRDYELALQDRDQKVAAFRRAEAGLRQARLDTQGDLNSLRASVASARSDSAKAAADLAKIRSDASAIGRQSVLAPRDGVIFRVNATEGSFLDKGKPIATIVPDTDQRMVQLWMDGNDIPLVREREVLADGTVDEGSLVRLQFEGWPAVQFIGWPSVARGTFGGEVVLIDPTDDGTGRFRVLVAERPDVVRDGEEVPWPDDRWLRQGVQVNGWVLLNRVPLWFEIWRQLNGFPPALPESPEGATQTAASK
jgi:multidrug efflux pump subunit AcrA (membrane-fusion protein)